MPHAGDERVARQIAARLVAAFRPERIIWFGSRAVGEPRPDSDWDLLVVAHTTEPLLDRMVRARRATADIPVAQDILVVTPEEHARLRTWKSSVVYDAEQRGLVLHEAA